MQTLSFEDQFDRRRFLQNLALTAAGLEYVSSLKLDAASESDTEGHTLICEFQIEATTWKVYEDLRSHEGRHNISFLTRQTSTRQKCPSHLPRHQASLPWFEPERHRNSGRRLVGRPTTTKRRPRPGAGKVGCPATGIVHATRR